MKTSTRAGAKNRATTKPPRDQQHEPAADLDEREVARRTQKPRSARESSKGPSNRKGPQPRK